ncbi:MAG: hypothetical protein LBR10_14555 [Prevotellaceae bacterium]|jgi:hypothetical protein|nr:hypothetical protein [Prevotellaceae bacterium]
METMKQKIQEVHDYFRGKLVRGDFKIVDITDHTVHVKIDDEYSFTIWSGSGAKYIRTADTCSYSFMNITFTQEDKEAIWDNLHPRIIRHKQEVLINEKQEEVEKLQKELKQLTENC